MIKGVLWEYKVAGSNPVDPTLRIKQNFEVIINLKTSPFAIQDKKSRDLDLAKEHPTLKDFMNEQGV